MQIQHSSRTDLWFTPSWVIDKVHQTIGYPDLDPSSCELANETVKATRYITEEQDALKTVWTKEPVTMFINSPGSKVKGKSQVCLFWDILMDYLEMGLVKDAIFMAFSAEALQTSQVFPKRSMGEFIICIPKRRIAFVSPEGDKNSPSHSNAIVYVPGLIDRSKLFYENFKDVGNILMPFSP